MLIRLSPFCLSPRLAISGITEICLTNRSNSLLHWHPSLQGSTGLWLTLQNYLNFASLVSLPCPQQQEKVEGGQKDSLTIDNLFLYENKNSVKISLPCLTQVTLLTFRDVFHSFWVSRSRLITTLTWKQDYNSSNPVLQS